jgi:hypothetical protein
VTTKAQLGAIAGAINEALFGPTGIYDRLPPLEQSMIGYFDQGGRWRWETEIFVEERPSRQLLHDIARGGDGVEGIVLQPGQHLLGLFTDGPSQMPTIQVFADEAAAVSHDPVDVAIHELGHRFEYDHSKLPALVGLTAGPPSQLPSVHVARNGNVESSCPVCLLEGNLARAEKALDGLRQRALLQHRIPQGLGGRIPETRRTLENAATQLALVSEMVPDRQGEVRSLQAQIDATQQALAGEALQPEDVSRAHALAYRAWDAAYDLGHAYYLGALYGSAGIDAPPVGAGGADGGG